MIRERLDSVLDTLKGDVERVYGRNGAIASLSKGRWLEFLFIGAIVVMAAGIVNAVIQPVSSGSIIYPNQGFQSIGETVMDAFVVLLGGAGIYVSYMSGRQTTKPRMVNFYLIIGLLLLATATYLGIYVYSAK